VGSGGVIGQVQVIETENGPMTVIYMEEGAEGTTETVSGSNAVELDGQTVTDENGVQYTYQVQGLESF